MESKVRKAISSIDLGGVDSHHARTSQQDDIRPRHPVDLIQTLRARVKIFGRNPDVPRMEFALREGRDAVPTIGWVRPIDESRNAGEARQDGHEERSHGQLKIGSRENWMN